MPTPISKTYLKIRARRDSRFGWELTEQDHRIGADFRAIPLGSEKTLRDCIPARRTVDVLARKRKETLEARGAEVVIVVGRAIGADGEEIN